MTNNPYEQKNYILKKKFTCIFAGPPKSGKTSLLNQFLDHRMHAFEELPDNIVFCYKRWQPIYTQLCSITPKIHFIMGLPKLTMFSENVCNLLILDDLMTDSGNDEAIKAIFTVDSNHLNICVFLLSQNLFCTEKYFRLISLNTNYMFIFNNPRDRSQFTHISRQIEPGNTQYLNECYLDAVESREYGYLFLDFHQTTNKIFRVQANFCFDDLNSIKRDIYLPKN